MVSLKSIRFVEMGWFACDSAAKKLIGSSPTESAMKMVLGMEAFDPLSSLSAEEKLNPLLNTCLGMLLGSEHLLEKGLPCSAAEYNCGHSPVPWSSLVKQACCVVDLGVVAGEK